MKTDEEVYSGGGVVILYWSLDNGQMMLANGDHFPITNWIDQYGEDTEVPEEVWSVVAGPDKQGKWWQTNAEICPMVPIQ